MKKYFMFAAVVTAGMLASCSSESLTGSDPEITTPAQEELVPIQIGVANNVSAKATTRGTGTAGGTGAANIWHGERINVLMYKIKEAAGVYSSSFEYVTDGTNHLYDTNALLVTPLEVQGTNTGIAKEPYDATAANDPDQNPGSAKYKVKYYPATGRADFWGYYLGGYGTGANASALAPAATLANKTYTPPVNPGDPATIADAADINAANVQTLAFIINGTHDLMVAKAATGDAATGAAITGEAFTTAQTTAVSGSGGNTDTYKASYSAKAARKGLQPELEFKHLLTRLTFKAQPGNENADGVQITAIKVHSKTTGNMIVSYKYDVLTGEPQRIIWDTPKSAADPTQNAADYTDYPIVVLKERTSTTNRTMKDLTAVDLDWITPAEIAAVTPGDGSHADEIHATTPQAYPSSIGEALIVAPQDQYYIEIEYVINAQDARNWFANYGTDYTEGVLNGSPVAIPTEPLKTTITKAGGFLAANSYEINITLYGPEEIKVTSTLLPWADGGQVTVIGE